MAVESAQPRVSDVAVDAADQRVGIVGAGKLGTTLARAAVAAGYDVAISGSGPADEIALTVDVLAPGARATTTEHVVRHADIIVLAVPTHRFRELPYDRFAGKILVDAMNYWEPVDGADDELAGAPGGTSMVVQERFPSARVVKSLNQLGYHELDELRRTKPAPDRIAIAAAGDDRLAVRRVMRLIDRLGFEPVDAGPLPNGRVLEPDGSPFAVTYSADELSKLVKAYASTPAPARRTRMSDESIAARIERLVDEEHGLRSREEHDSSDADALQADRARLRDVEVELDRCWDLLRRRRALRSAGADPDQAHARDADTVEGYLQ